MSPTNTITELQILSTPARSQASLQHSNHSGFTLRSEPEQTLVNDGPPQDAFDAIPDGGLQAWTQIFACAAFLFWTNGWASTWGVLQANILRSTYLQVNTSTITFVGSLALACLVAFSLIWVRVIKLLGARLTCVLAAVLMGSGTILASATLHNLGGLFVTAGAMFGIGSCALYTIGNMLPPQWFSSKLGVSNGLVKAGGGIGATVLPVAAQKAIDTIGLPWTFRLFGILMLATAVPCSLLLKQRTRTSQARKINWAMLKDVSFLCICLGGAVTTFALFVPPFFIPLFSESIGLSPSTGAALVAGFGMSSTTGRFVAGYACDKIGPMNTLSITLAINAGSMLAIWPVSSTLAPLVIFAVINGCANGAYFSAFPVAVASLGRSEHAVAAMSLSTSMWAPGYLLGSSVAGILISKTGAAGSSSIGPYRAAIFYAGGVALLGAILTFMSRLKSNPKFLKKL